ncbi:AEC family transporter [Marinomonas hwangdonensis]|uniref:AEC family transporter n=1 Tax=Marinomonas hwangdonensis TaxID=1053647 RepID=A0A3M8Q8F0_9GAMM|nr:AEC family transporter [Marinomonas hwangdonensis]RNF52329.1 AEC family transporter [Marinomonas hwangdonensis]
MFSLSLSVLPVFLLLVAGAVCQRWRFPMDGFWQGVDKLSYWVLFPALLFHKTSQIDFSNPLLPKYALILLLALVVTASFVFASVWVMKVVAPTASSMLQAGVRFNTFIVLALAGSVYGNEGLVLAALGASVLIPSINVFLVVSMTLMHGPSSADQGLSVSLPRLLSGALIRNPLIVSIVLGSGLNVLGLTPILLLSEVVGMVSQAALPLVLLAVGASVRLEAIRSVGMTFVMSSAARFVVFPLVIGLMCWWLDVRGLPALVAVLFGVVPTATSAYALARQLGGDADRIAAYITMQTLLSVVTVPVSIWLSQQFLS